MVVSSAFYHMETKVIEYNAAQAMLVVMKQQTKAKTFVLEWGRGTGKSTIIGRHMYDCVTEMPRSLGVLVGSTYSQIKTRTLPSTIAGLEQHEIYQDKHYVIGKFPPDEWKWPKPYQSILDPKNAMFWYNGTVIIFVSLDGGASSGRGINADFAIGDEAALFDQQKFQTDVDATVRGNLHKLAIYPDKSTKAFGECRHHHSILLATSTPLTQSGMWILDYEQQAKNDSNSVVFIQASAIVNIKNLGKRYFERNKASMPDFLYEAEIEGKRITQIRDGFYPKFVESQHTYVPKENDYYKTADVGVAPTCLGDSDLFTDQPLHLAMDWGANINCLIVAQPTRDELRILKNFYVLAPKIMDDVIVEHFVPYYEAHKRRNNTIYLWYDASGNNRQANSRLTYAQQIRSLLHNYGWNVELKTKSRVNEKHDKKYRLAIDIMTESSVEYPKLKINSRNCRELIISIKNSPAKKGTKQIIQKDKRSEHKNNKTPQQHATHFSDTFDIIMVGLYMRLLDKRQNMPETRTI